MKSIIFKSAWAIFRMENVSFSEALKLAWNKAKENTYAYIMKANKLVKSKGLGFETIYFNELSFANIETKKSICTNTGAAQYYNGKTFNND